MHAQCPQCGYTVSDSSAPYRPNFRPWHIIHGRAGVKAYVASLGHEAHEWLLALYVDESLQLLAVDTVARGDVQSCDVPFWKLIDRGHQLKAAGFVLVHNHPSGDVRASTDDIRVTCRLAHVSRELDMPLLGSHIIAGDEMSDIGYW